MGKGRLYALLMAGLVIAAVLAWPAQRRKKSEEEVTQKLEVVPEPPGAVTAETNRLEFRTAPLSSKGLLSQQVRDGVKWLMSANRRATVVKIRAYVAGSGDVRRVQSVVSEAFNDRRLPVPALSVVQVGDLPREGAQVALESIAVERKTLNPHGLAFISGQLVTSEEAILKVAPLVEKSLGQLKTALAAVGLAEKDVLRLTCYCSSIQDAHEIRREMMERFPKAALNFLQLRRAYTTGLVECEAVARLAAPAGEPVRFLNPEGLAKSPNYSQIALVSAPRIVLTGTQLAFRYQDSDVRLAFERLSKTLEEARTSFGNVAMAHIYPLSMYMMEKIRDLRFEFFDKARPPASTMVEFEGLPGMDASFALDVVAVVP